MMPSPESNHRTPGLVPLAPAKHPATKSPPGQSDAGDLMPYTCVTCAKRKVKCDKAKPPCAACRKGRLECFYQAPAPRRPKRKATEDVHERLHRFERLLKENGILPPPNRDGESSPAEAPPKKVIDPLTGQENAQSKNGSHRPSPLAGNLLKNGPGRTRYVDSQLWRNLGEALHPSSDEEEDDLDHNDHSSPGPNEIVDPLSASFLGATPPSVDFLYLHPPYETALKLWKIFTTNIDPILKIVHVPTGLITVQQAAANPSGMNKVTECFLFSIYHFVVSIISDQECEEICGNSRKSLQNAYQNATRQALVSCQFLRTTELMVLQAYMLYLISIRNRGDVHTLWILTGIAVRIAQRMGLHRDGEELGLNPFDVEMRRRIFWQVVTLDAMVSQLSGTGIATSRDTFNTKRPSNLNDEDIWPGMPEPPVPTKSATDMMFCLVRTEMGVFHAQHRLKFSNWSDMANHPNFGELEAAVDGLENHMEENYIRYCDITNPVHCMALALVRGAMNGMRLRIRVPRAKSSGATPAERKSLSALACKTMRMEVTVLQNATLNRYQWHMKGILMADPIIWILGEMRHADPQVDFEEAWGLVAKIFDARSEFTSPKRAIFIAIARLILKAWEATQAQPDLHIPEPSFLAALRKSLDRRDASRSTSSETPPLPHITPAARNGAGVPAAQYPSANPHTSSLMLDASKTSTMSLPFLQDPVEGIPNFTHWGLMDDFNVDPGWMMWDSIDATAQQPAMLAQGANPGPMYVPGSTAPP